MSYGHGCDLSTTKNYVWSYDLAFKWQKHTNNFYLEPFDIGHACETYKYRVDQETEDTATPRRLSLTKGLSCILL